MTQDSLENQLGRKLNMTEQVMYNLMSAKENYKIEIVENTFRFILK